MEDSFVVAPVQNSLGFCLNKASILAKYDLCLFLIA